MTNINVLKYTAALCNALVENYMVQQIESCKRTLQSKPKSKVTKERLEMLEAGTPLKVLRIWDNDDGKYWLHVEIVTGKLLDLSCVVKHGWVDV